MAKVSMKKMNEAIDYRDEIREADNSLRSMQSRYKASGASLTRPKNTYQNWVDHLDELESPKELDSNDEKYQKVWAQTKKWHEKLMLTREEIEIDLSLRDIPDPESTPLPPEVEIEIEGISSHINTERVVVNEAPENKPSSVLLLEGGSLMNAVYLEDMFVFQGNQILQVFGTSKIVELFAKIISPEMVVADEN